MIIAIGHDLIELERIRKTWASSGDSFLQRIFTPAELEYCLRSSDPVPSLAARFAAKEAFQKVWPVVHGWRDVGVVREPTPDGPFKFSKPRLEFSLELAATMRARGWRAHLSLTHTKEHASAVVLLEEI